MLVLDAGALVALERAERVMWRRLKLAHVAGDEPVTHGGIVGQVWRGRGPREALLAQALSGMCIQPLDESLGRSAGALLAAARQSDVIDAALVRLARDGDTLLTSDVEDLARLARAADLHVDIVRA